MRKSFVLLLILLVLLPVIATAWVAVRLLGDEQKRVDFQLSALVDGQLQSVNDALSAYLVVRESELKIAAQALQNKPGDALRSYARNSAHVRQMLLFSEAGELLFPNAAGVLSNRERQFLQHSEGLWKNAPFISPSEQAEKLPSKPQKTKNRKGFRLDSFLRDEYKQAAKPRQAETFVATGWYVWDWGSETHWLYWLKSTTGKVVAFEIEPARLMADLIAYLPSTTKLSEDDDNVMRVRVVDTRGSVWYQWGEYRPTDNETPSAVRPLVHPLAHWQLEYYGADTANLAGKGKVGIMLAALLFASLLLLLLVFALRQYKREMALAEQRVNFVNQVSHELKTPLTNIRLYAELLDEQIEEPQQRNMLEVIVTESQRLSRLIANVLSFGKAEKQTLTLHPQPVDIAATLAQCLANFSAAFEQKNINHKLSCDVQEVMCDRAVLEQIVNNLLSNVEKYAPETDCHISAKLVAEELVITVSDSGIGLSKSEAKKVFEPFYRVSNNMNDGVSGAGLGLAISAQLAGLHGGSLKLLDSAAGCCFELRLKVSNENINR